MHHKIGKNKLHKAFFTFIKFLLIALLFVGLNPIEKRQDFVLKTSQKVELTQFTLPVSTAENLVFGFNISVSGYQISKALFALSNQHTQLVVNRHYSEIFRISNQVYPKFSKVYIPFPFHFFF